MGHQIGLGHSHIVLGDYQEDLTSYMAAGWISRTKPLQTFNGPDNWFLGWFEKRTMYVEPLVDEPQLVHLAALVDFKKTKAHQPVILVVGTGNETYYLQYNRAKGFNNETRAFKDWVTIHTATWYASSERKGAIRLNEFATSEEKGSIRLPLFTATNYSGSGRDLLIQVCADKPGNEKRRPDVMVISVGLGKTLCNVTADDDGDDEDGDSFDESWKGGAASSPSSVKNADPAPRPMKKNNKRTKVPATSAPSEAPKKRMMMRRTKAPAIVTTTATPSESPLTKEQAASTLRRPSRSPTTTTTIRPSVAPATAPTTASPTRDVPGGSLPRPFPTTGSNGQDSYMYIVSLLLAAIAAWGVFIFLY
jgi:hypothetical protein